MKYLTNVCSAPVVRWAFLIRMLDRERSRAEKRPMQMPRYSKRRFGGVAVGVASGTRRFRPTAVSSFRVLGMTESGI